MDIVLDDDYKEWILGLKSTIRSMQLKAALAVNSALIEFYWELGRMIAEKQTAWGSQFLDTLSKDLKKEFPDMEGLSVRNLKYSRQFYQFYTSPDTSQLEAEFGQQAVAQIPWGHNILIFSKSRNIGEANFYLQKTIENGWSRDVLGLQIKSQLYERQGKAITNFTNTLPDPMSDLATQILKDPYNFDFLSMTENYKERDLENALVDNVTKFLLELGTGFAYVGKQIPLQVGDQDYFIDLLFYHLKLRAYVLIELKVTDFIPEYAGKLSFYLSVANDVLRHPTDNPTIGLLICKNKNNIIAEYSLKNINQPIGVTEYQLTRLFPEEFKSSLPTIEEIETELKNLG